MLTMRISLVQPLIVDRPVKHECQQAKQAETRGVLCVHDDQTEGLRCSMASKLATLASTRWFRLCCKPSWEASVERSQMG